MPDKLNELFAVLLGLIAATIVIWLTGIDLLVADLAFTAESGWFGVNAYLWELVYRWAPVPAWLMGGIALLILIGGWRLEKCRRWRKQALFILLFLLLGPGLIANVILKDNLGRPRPREVKVFAGEYRYHQFWEPGEAGRNSSFPSGHASIAFALIGPWFLLREKHRGDALFCLAIGLGWGGVVGLGRILQGGHFVSDTLWAGGIVYLTGQLLAIWLSPEKGIDD